MKFFNIRYECNDARDDLFCTLKQRNVTDGVFPHWFTSDNGENLVDDNYDDEADFASHEEYEVDQYTSIGKRVIKE